MIVMPHPPAGKREMHPMKSDIMMRLLLHHLIMFVIYALEKVDSHNGFLCISVLDMNKFRTIIGHLFFYTFSVIKIRASTTNILKLV